MFEPSELLCPLFYLLNHAYGHVDRFGLAIHLVSQMPRWAFAPWPCCFAKGALDKGPDLAELFKDACLELVMPVFGCIISFHVRSIYTYDIGAIKKRVRKYFFQHVHLK